MPLPLKYYYQVRQGVDPLTYSTSGCLCPNKMTIYDGLTSKYRKMYIDCGQCVNCINDRRNQWVSRMCLHSLSWKHCYFVTLTYGSYDLNLYKKHPFKESWLETYPSYDKYNSFGAYRWTPSILVSSHVQKFLKRLRFNTSATISYCAAGEYGGQYGRPHYHLVIWSDKPISDLDFQRAWSYKCVKTEDKYTILPYNGRQKDFFYFRLGRVQVDDLVKNGTLDWQAEYDGSPHSANNCFQYVAKYISKSYFSTHVQNKFVYARLRSVFIALPLDLNVFDPADIPYLVMKEKLSNPFKKLDCLEEKDSFIYHCFTYNSISYEKIDFPKFCKVVAPFFLSSRMYSIGKQYALENLSRFEAGNFSLPKFQGRQLAFPHYFGRLASFKKNPVRLRKTTPRGVSLVKGSLENLYRYYDLLRQDSSIYYSLQEYSTHQAQIQYRPFSKSTISDKSINGELTDISIYDGQGSLITYLYFPYNELFVGYKYDRSTRSYYVVEQCDRIDFCDWICKLIDDNMKDIPKLENRQRNLFDLRDQIESTPGVREKRIEYMNLKDYKQALYELEHRDKTDLQ